MHQSTQLAIPAPDEAVQQAAIDAYNLQKANLSDDEVILHIDGVHPTHMAKTGKIWMKKGETRHILRRFFLSFLQTLSPKPVSTFGVLGAYRTPKIKYPWCD